MKRILTLALLIASTAVSALAQNGKAIYQKFSDRKDVSAVYISPAMFRMIGKLPDIQLEGDNVNLGPIVKSLTGLYVISGSEPSFAQDLAKDVDTFVKSGRYELLMEAKEEGEIVKIYTLGTEKIINTFVMVAAEDDETTFICLDGKIEREALEKLLAAYMSDEY